MDQSYSVDLKQTNIAPRQRRILKSDAPKQKNKNKKNCT